MDKNWLIRTKSNHILGPVSKEKLLELYSSKSIKPDDEVCSGNGYWFYLRETDLVERYLTGDEIQGFNPISEAKNILTASRPHQKEPTLDDITLVKALNVKDLKQETKDGGSVILGKQRLTQESNKSPADLELDVKKKVTTETQSDRSGKKNVSTGHPKQQLYLKYLMALGFLLLLCLLYYRKTILNSIFTTSSNWNIGIDIVSSAHAQESKNEIQKKSF